MVPKTCLAAVLNKHNRPLSIQKIEIPKLKYGQVLVKIYFTAICGSQLMEIKGARNTKKFLPHLLGHEASAKVVKIGSGVKKVKINQDVILSWIKGKGIEAPLASYKNKKLKINSGRVTTFSQYSVVSENRLYLKPKNISLKNSVLYGCALPTGVGMIFNHVKQFKRDIQIIIAGIGGVGLSCYYALKILKFKNILILEKSKDKINFIKKKLKIKNAKLFNLKNLKSNYGYTKKKLDLFIDNTGDKSVLEHAYKIIDIKGTLLFSSHPPFQQKILLDPKGFLDGKRVIGTRGGEMNLDKDIKKFTTLLKKNNFNYKSFFSKSYKLVEINKAIKDMKKGRVIRPLIKLM